MRVNMNKTSIRTRGGDVLQVRHHTGHCTILDGLSSVSLSHIKRDETPLCFGTYITFNLIFDASLDSIAFSALTLLVGRQEEHPAIKN